MAYADNTPRTVAEMAPRFPITLAGTVEMGDLLGYSSGWVQADADAGITAQLIALEAGDSGDVINVTAVAIVSSVSDATPGDTAYLSTTAGAIAATDPGDSNTQEVGVFLSATSVLLAPLFYTIPVLD